MIYKFKYLFLSIFMLVSQFAFASDQKIRTFVKVVDRRAMVKEDRLTYAEAIAEEKLISQLVAEHYGVAPECVAVETGRSAVTGSVAAGFNLVSIKYTATIRN